MGESRHGATVRLSREERTLRAMVQIYCRAHHATHGPLCAECQSLYDYAIGRLDRCPLGPRKTTCGQCTTHCYKPSMRVRVQAVMRYSGRRMLLRHPVLALLHLLDAFGWHLH